MKLHSHRTSDFEDFPAAFRRLCVETLLSGLGSSEKDPAAFRRLCVETQGTVIKEIDKKTSRLQAAVC